MTTFSARDVYNKSITVESTKTMNEVRDMMLKLDISRVIITQNQKPVGMVTEKGISRYLYWDKDNQPLDKITISKAMRAPLISVSSDTSIKTCAKLMLDNDISSLIVKEDKDKDKEEIYIFTKSDLVKLYSQNYKGQYRVDDFMTRKVFTTAPSNSLHTVLKILLKNRISRVIVTTDDGDMAGIITARDLMPITAFVEGEKLHTGKGKNTDNTNDMVAIGHVMIARDVMNKPISVKSNADLADTAKIMTDKRISGIPVVDPNNDTQLVGIITKTDIVKALLE
ncbi:CBS domain-containing protein [soil metagenome]